jgi:hypothetical protein
MKKYSVGKRSFEEVANAVGRKARQVGVPQGKTPNRFVPNP